ncbi:WD40/YVTN repeat-like-containing domain protein [Raphanus sativus]|nr:WD40/YVTN repeat-like-containing domain protein [Raphanus sativus]
MIEFTVLIDRWSRVTSLSNPILRPSLFISLFAGLESVLVLESPNGRKRINRAVWGPLNQTIVSGGEDAVLRIWDAETGKLLKESDAEVGHKNTITSLTKAADDSHFITGSLDKTAKLWDMRTLTLLKTYVSGVPVVLGGGQDASVVTTTDHRAGKFEAKFYDKKHQGPETLCYLCTSKIGRCGSWSDNFPCLFL